MRYHSTDTSAVTFEVTQIVNVVTCCNHCKGNLQKTLVFATGKTSNGFKIKKNNWDISTNISSTTSAD